MYNKSQRSFNNKKIIISFLLTIASIFIMFLMGASYETNDDWSIALQLSRGEVNVSSFQSPYLALLISKIYLVFPSLPWWGILAFCGAASLLWVSYSIILSMCKGAKKYLFLFSIFSIIWSVGIKQVNFTRTAILFTIAGCLLCTMYLCILGGKFDFLLGIVCIALGGMIRFQAALVAIPFFLSTNLFCYIYSERKDKPKFSWILGGAAPILILLCLYVFNNVYYNNNTEWKDYQDYNYKRGLIQDYTDRYPSWEEASEQYKKMGLKEHDETLFIYKWFSEDTEVFNEKVLEDIISLSNSHINLKEALSNVFQQLKSNIIFWMLAIWGIYIFVEFKKRILLPLILIDIGGIGIITYFSIQGRVQNRVTESVLLCALYSLLYIYIFMSARYRSEDSNLSLVITTYNIENNQKKKLNRNSISILSLMFSFLVIILLYNSIEYNLKNMHIPYFDEGKNEIVREKTDYIDSTKERIYFLTVLSDDWDKGFNMWENVPVGYCDNAFFLGGWSARTPDNIKRLRDLDIGNPVRALFEKENCYTIYDNDIFEFLKRHYNLNMTCTRVDNFNDDNNTSIVQYTEPKDKPKKIDKSVSKISINVSEYCEIDQNGGWTIDGNLDFTKSTEYRSLYCNVKVGNNLYSYRLNYEEGHFAGDLYNLNDLVEEGISEIYLIGETSSNEFYYLGDLIEWID